MQETFGPLIRLWGVNRHLLPPPDAEAQSLTAFLTALLEEALPFIDSVSPKAPTSSPPPPPPTPWKQKSAKSFPASAAKVQLLERRVTAKQLAEAATVAAGAPTSAARDEIWACRLSVHRDEATTGTASWAEFRAAMKEDHAGSEEKFTPTVVAARTAVDWTGAPSVSPIRSHGETWGAFTLKLEEMRHAVGRPVLKDRVFSVLQMTCSALEPGGQEREEFVVVSVTVNGFDETETAVQSKGNDVVIASYASVERVMKLPGGEIEWIMATASDARGVLPGWVQSLAVPGQIAKDVALFLGWIDKERNKG